MIKLSQLYHYPLKSAAGIALAESDVDGFGLKNDRRYMLVDQHGQFLSQRQLPTMCLIEVAVIDNTIDIKLPNGERINCSPKPKSKVQVTVWQDNCSAYDCGDAAAAILSEYLETTCRLVYFPETETRQVDLQYAKLGDKTGFSDGFPLLLISEASLQDLNSRLQQPVTMSRFRPNLVVSGCHAFAEDEWQQIKIGDLMLRVVKPCSRCSIPSVDPATGIRSAEPTKTLRTYRLKESKVLFGQNVIADMTKQTLGALKCGMPVEIIK